MKPLRNLVLALITVGFVGCVPRQPISIPSSRSAQSHILTSIQLNSGEINNTLLAVVDTGCEWSILSNNFVPSNQNPTVNVRLNDATQSQVSMNKKVTGRLKIGEAHLDSCDFLVMNLKDVAPPQLKNIDAILGQNELMRLSPISFDFKHNSIIINDDDSYDAVFPLLLIKNLPAIDVILNGEHTQFVIDTGSYLSATISSLETNSANPPDGVESEYGSASGVRLKAKRSINNKIKIGAILFDSIDVWLQPTSHYPTLGSSFFRNHKIKMDYKKMSFSIKLQE